MRCSYFRLHTYSAHPLTPLSVSALTAFCVRLWGARGADGVDRQAQQTASYNTDGLSKSLRKKPC